MVEKYYAEQSVDIYCGHVLNVLKSLEDESVQMCLTSPPYWGLRNYAGGTDIVWGGDENCKHQWIEETQGLQHENRNNLRGTQEEVIGKTGTAFIQKYDRLPAGICVKCGAWRGQLGLEPTPELYVEHLIMIFREVKRVLRRDGSFYLNIGDTYSATRSYQVTQSKWQSSELDVAGIPMIATMTPKCMVCIPERVMFAMIEDGWILHNKIVWHKPNSMPSSVKDRFTTTWEYMYFFGKNSNTILWRNRLTGEWRDARPTKEENYPWGGMYYNQKIQEYSWKKIDGCVKIMPLWMGFDHYFDLDAVRVPHKTQSLERYQRGVNLDRPAIGKSAEVGSMQQYTRAPEWFKEMFPPDEDYRGKFDDLFGHGPNPQSFNLRVRDVKRGKRGTTAQSGELKASDKEVEEYEYPEKHHGSSHHGRAGIGNLTKHDQAVGRTGNIAYTDPLLTRDYSPKGKNPGDYWEITTQPSSICVCPSCFTVFPRMTKVCPQCGIEGVTGHFAPFPEALCERPILASSRVGDVVMDFLAGTGTVGVEAKRLGRKVILIDCVEEYCAMSRERVKKVEYQPRLELEELAEIVEEAR